MTDTSSFAEKFADLLARTGFPGSMTPDEKLRQVDAVISALTVKVLADVGAGRLQFRDFLYQGPRGGGGPHRLDLLVRYSTEAAQSEISDR